MGRREEPSWARGTLGLTAARERGDIDRKFQNRLTVTRNMIDRLGLEMELNGHNGCVNCLEWNQTGSILASASDDLHVILWDPYRHKQLRNITTGHTGNIFSVKFLSQDTIITCSADGSIRAQNISMGDSLFECSCHCGRVKRLACAPDRPNIVWSSSEDGLILQHDLRSPPNCSRNPKNVLVNLLNHMGRYAETKCVAVNPRRPYQLAVGANDFYVRVYDTRMIKLGFLKDAISSNTSTGVGLMWERQVMQCSIAGQGDRDNNIPREAVQYFAPGHLSIEPHEHRFPKKAATYLTFSEDGTELLVNLGSEQIYLYDINSAPRPILLESFIIQHNHGRREGDAKQGPKNGTIESGANGTSMHINGSIMDISGTSYGANGTIEQQNQLPPRVLNLKEMANEHVNNGNYTLAVELYNNAIAECSNCAILYSNRAAALMRRGWCGDTYSATRDCYMAIKLDPNHVKSHFRLAKSLMDLKQPKEAHECLLYFKDKFPRHAESHAVFLLQKDINVAMEAMEAKADEADQEERVLLASPLEREKRTVALDYKERFLGHCNTTTDIKEAIFLGPEANYIAAGSDDGSFFIWCRKTGNIIRCLRGDESIVNCVQQHPSMFLLATSGIETTVRLWSPRAEEGALDARVVSETAVAATANQQRMRSDPFEAMLLNISFADGPDREMNPPACRAT